MNLKENLLEGGDPVEEEGERIKKTASEHVMEESKKRKKIHRGKRKNKDEVTGRLQKKWMESVDQWKEVINKMESIKNKKDLIKKKKEAKSNNMY